MVVLYLIYLLVRCIKNVSLPNIITGENIVPELIQYKFNIENISYETERLLYDKKYREDVINKLGNVREKLSDKFSAKEAADCVRQELTKENPV